MDWCDLYFHAVDPQTQQIAPVDEILKDIDRNYDYLKVAYLNSNLLIFFEVIFLVC